MLSPLPTRRAWMKFSAVSSCAGQHVVVLHPEGVDRNIFANIVPLCTPVALHPEGVDRNIRKHMPCTNVALVALHPEGRG